MTEKQKKYIAGAGVLAFLLLSGLVFWYAGNPLIQFMEEPERFRAWVDGKGIWGRLAFLGMVILQVFVAVIPGEPLEIAAGYAFGFWEGTLLCLIGMTIGGVLVFLFVRRFGVRAVEIFFSRQRLDSVRFLHNTKRLYAVTLAVFLLPGTPKDLLSYAVGLTPIPFSHWLLITSICRLPSIATSTFGGSALGTGKPLQAVLIFLATMLISLTGLAVYRRIQLRHTQSNSSAL